MKTVTSSIFLATLVLASIGSAAPKLPTAKLLDLYAVREGNTYVVHVLASGDISQFLSDRKKGDGSYRLTLDVPALSPMDSKYDVTTPFSRRFEVWPMQLGKKVYSRIEIELAVDASSVVGMENASHLFIRIQKDSPIPPGVTVAGERKQSAPPPSTSQPSPRDEASPVDAATLGLPREPEVADGGSKEGAEPFEPVTVTPPPSTNVAETSAGDVDSTDDELFFSLFPTPAKTQQTLFNIAVDDVMAYEEPVSGIRVGRFSVRPSIDLSWVRGDNLLLSSEEPFVDNAYMVRGRVVATLLDSVHDLRIAYEGRYRDFKSFTLEEKFTQFVEFEAGLQVTPTSKAKVTNRYVRGSFESQEFDPGGEVIASTDPFYRNLTKGTYGFELSERFGAEVNASYNLVRFLEPSTEFFDYDVRDYGATFLYNLSPLTSLLGEYVRTAIPAPIQRPIAASEGNTFLFGLRGELTPFLRGQVRAGYSDQRFIQATVPQNYSGFVADASLTQDFGEAMALTGWLGRRTNPSAFQQSGYYVSNYGRVQFISPFARNFRVTATGSFFLNDYPVPDVNGVFRNDDIVSGGVGLAYFFTPMSFFSLDYRHDRRSSNIENFAYHNNAIQLMVGFGFMNR